MNKLRIGSILEFDSIKSRKEAYNCGKRQGAVEELEHLLKVLDEDFGMPKYSGEIVVKFMKERLKELKKGVEK
jgi:transcriptional regulator NrdR family protein